MLGQADFVSGESNRGSDLPTDSSLFWCYNLQWDGRNLWVADTGNRRVLMWKGIPETNGQPADMILGQDNFNIRDENGGDVPDGTSMRWPHAITVWCRRLCVADAGNNRIMIWNETPKSNNQPCDYVLGQKDLTGVDHNQSNYFPISAGLNMPYGMTSVGDWLLVADTASSRLLGWHKDDDTSGAAARLLSGQYTFQDKGDNRWQMPVRDSICWPYGLYAKGDKVVVADSGNSRALIWRVSDEVKGSMSVPPA